MKKKSQVGIFLALTCKHITPSSQSLDNYLEVFVNKKGFHHTQLFFGDPGLRKEQPKIWVSTHRRLKMMLLCMLKTSPSITPAVIHSRDESICQRRRNSESGFCNKEFEHLF